MISKKGDICLPLFGKGRHKKFRKRRKRKCNRGFLKKNYNTIYFNFVYKSVHISILGFTMYNKESDS